MRIRASWVRGILCLAHVAVTSTRLPVLFPTTAPAHRLLRVLGELVQTTSGKRITPPTGAMLERSQPRPGAVLVGHQACLGHGGGHTRWTCRTYDQTRYGPPTNTHCHTLDARAVVRISNAT